MKRILSASPYFDDSSIDNILQEIRSTLKSGVLIDGPNTKEFETQFAEYVGTKHAVAVNSGTAALEIMLRYYNLKGKEVIVPTNTFVATPTAVLFSGGRPVFADMNAETLCIDVADAKKKVTTKTCGVIVVHVAGLVCPQINELREFCVENDLFILEDAAHAHGAMIDGKKAGSLANGGAFSFYPTKVMTTGHGGMIVTNNGEMASIAYSVRNHGLDSTREMRFLGDNWCMSEITAIIGKYQLSCLESFLEKRNKLAEKYTELLAKVADVHLLPVPNNIRHSYYKFPIRLSDNIDCEKIAKTLRFEFGVDTGSIYCPPCHLHPWFRRKLKLPEGSLPISESVLKHILCLPIHVQMKIEDCGYVVDSLRNSLRL